MTVLSVDLASRRYRDNGIALLHGTAGDIRCEIIAAQALGLRDEPEAQPFAEALLQLARSAGARLILLDGPQGWRAEQSTLLHQRHCERATLAPGKTGLPGIVKPASWTRMALFSIAMFDALDARGWPRFTATWSGAAAAIESFPTQAWRSLGRPAMPGRANTPSIAPWVRHLQQLGVRGLREEHTHDDVQAVVAGLAGLQLLEFGHAGVDARGCDPHQELGTWREGWIVCPTRH